MGTETRSYLGVTYHKGSAGYEMTRLLTNAATAHGEYIAPCEAASLPDAEIAAEHAYGQWAKSNFVDYRSWARWQQALRALERFDI